MARPIPVEVPRKACTQLTQFILLTDTGREAEQGSLPSVEDMSAEQKSCALAALLRITIASASSATGIVKTGCTVYAVSNDPSIKMDTLLSAVYSRNFYISSYVSAGW
jgi:hypothetical protein